MGILEQYKEALKKENENKDMNFPSETDLTEKDKKAYEDMLKKFRNGSFSNEEVKEAIDNSKKNMEELSEKHVGLQNEGFISSDITKLSEEDLISGNLLKEYPISDIKVIRAYCPKCGKEFISSAPPMYNPFTMTKMCLHKCCGIKYNLDKTYPHIAFYDVNGEEIKSYFQ